MIICRPINMINSHVTLRLIWPPRQSGQLLGAKMIRCFKSLTFYLPTQGLVRGVFLARRWLCVLPSQMCQAFLLRWVGHTVVKLSKVVVCSKDIQIWDCGIVVSASKFSGYRSPPSVLCLVSLHLLMCFYWNQFLVLVLLMAIFQLAGDPIVQCFSRAIGYNCAYWIRFNDHKGCQQTSACVAQVEVLTKNGIRVKFPPGRRQAHGYI